MKAIESTCDKFDIISTSSASLDIALGIGGIPTKKFVEISGPWSVGKSTLAMQIVSQAQKEKRPCVYADAEFSFSVDYATSLGVDCEKLELLQESYAELLLDAVEKWATENKNGLIILDAVGSLLPREEAEKGNEGRSIGLQARLIGSFTRRIIPALNLNNHAFVVINHTFTDLSTGRLKTSGGEKLAYAKSIWINLRRTFGKQARKSSDGTKTVLYIEAEIKKNKISPTEGKKAEMVMIPGQGFVSEEPEKKRGRPAKTKL